MSGLHIKRFIDRLNDLQASGAKDYTMTMHDARNLHSDITKLLLDARESQPTEDVVNIEVKGGSF
jgi:hypothetical protein